MTRGFQLEVQDLHRMAQLAHLERDPRVQRLLLAAGITGDASLHQIARDVLGPVAAREVVTGNPFPKPLRQDLAQMAAHRPCLLLGKVKGTDIPVLWPADWFSEHAFVPGASGTGKTALLTSTCLQLAKLNLPFIALDHFKEDFRHLIPFVPQLSVFDADTMVLNPLEPHAPISPEQTITNFAWLFTQQFDLLIGSQAYLVEVLHALSKKAGVFAGSEQYVTLEHVFAHIRGLHIKGYREQGYRDSVLNRLALNLREYPNYRYAKGFPIAELARRSFVLELKKLSEKHGRFLGSYLLFLLFQWRLARGERSGTVRNVAIIDEAHWFAPPNRSDQLGMPPIAKLLAMSREAGLGLVLASQSCDVDPSVMQNTKLKIAFRLGDGSDIERVRKSFALTDEQAAKLPFLGTGECVVRMPGLDPFLMQTPHLTLQGAASCASPQPLA